MSAYNSSKNTKKTLDTQHNNKLNEFQSNTEKLNTLKQKFNSTLERIMELECSKISNLSRDEQDTLISLIDERDHLRKCIQDIENNEDEIDYLINTAPILFKYYDIVEKGNDDDNFKPKINENSILKWLVKNQEEPSDTSKEDRASLLEKYMSYTDDNFVKPIENETNYQCMNCGCDNMHILLNDGIIYCNECSCVEYIIVDHDRPSYKDPPKEISYFAYKRINHFNEYCIRCFSIKIIIYLNI